eukprot:s758_g6.t1
MCFCSFSVLHCHGVFLLGGYRSGASGSLYCLPGGYRSERLEASIAFLAQDHSQQQRASSSSSSSHGSKNECTSSKRGDRAGASGSFYSASWDSERTLGTFRVCFCSFCVLHCHRVFLLGGYRSGASGSFYCFPGATVLERPEASILFPGIQKRR